MRAETYGLDPAYVVRSDKRREYRPFNAALILQQLIEDEALTIDEYLPAMDGDPFFLVAATGLGKTVAVPPHVWLRQCQQLKAAHAAALPRVWVVEPRVMITDEQGPYMHATFSQTHREVGLRGRPASFFGSVSSSKTERPDAPIVFLTTGVFSLKARGGDFRPGLDRIIIDEAHETVAQNPDVELGIAICREAGVVIDYMSATVDTASIPTLLGIDVGNVIRADKKRHPIYIANVGRTMADSIADIVRELLVEQRRDSLLLPGADDPLRQRIIADVYGGEPRAHGLLVAINSVSGGRSDAKTVQRKLREANLEMDGQPLDVIELSAKQTRNLREMARFNERRQEIEETARPYVVVATSVIEMGVTIPTLDFVVTMDSGFANVVVGDRTLPEVVPLPLNSLKQRLGRVGRRRAGVGLITKEVGAPYTAFPPDQLNSDDLDYEPVKTPLASASLLQLAYFTYERGWATPEEVGEGLARLQLPSRRHVISVRRLTELVEERRYLQRLGIVTADGQLSAVGDSVRAWIGDGHLPYAVRLQRALRSPPPVNRIEVLFWAVALAASDVTLSSLLQRRVSLDQMRDAPSPSGLGAGELSNTNELVGLFQLACALGATYGPYLREESSPLYSLHVAAQSALRQHAEGLGMDASRVEAFLSEIEKKIIRVARANRAYPDAVKAVFGTEQPKHLGDLEWPTCDARTASRLGGMVGELPGRPQLTLEREERKGGSEIVFFWRLAGRRVAPAGGGTPQLSSEQAERTRFTGRLQLRREPYDALWLDVAHFAQVA